MSGQTANIGAVPVKCDAPRHRFDVLFVQTRCRAMFARGYAFITGFDTTLVLFMRHNFSSPFWFCCCFKRRIRNPAESRDSGRARSQCSQGHTYKSGRDDACFCDLEQIHTVGAACGGPVCKWKEAIGSSRTIDRTPLNRSEQSTGF